MQRPSPRFRSEEYFRIRDIRRNVLPKLETWRRHAGAYPDEHQHGGRKPTETFVTEFCYKTVNLFLEELINIKVIFFVIHKLFSPADAHLDEQTSVTEFCYKSVNLFFEKLINIKVILFLIHELFR